MQQAPRLHIIIDGGFHSPCYNKSGPEKRVFKDGNQIGRLSIFCPSLLPTAAIFQTGGSNPYLGTLRPARGVSGVGMGGLFAAYVVIFRRGGGVSPKPSGGVNPLNPLCPGMLKPLFLPPPFISCVRRSSLYCPRSFSRLFEEEKVFA